MAKSKKEDKKESKTQNGGVFDKITSFFGDSLKDFVLAQIEKKKQEIVQNFEQKIVSKVKNEIRKTITKIIFGILLALGIGFLIYGGLEVIAVLFKLPEFMVPILFGVLLLGLAIIIKITQE